MVRASDYESEDCRFESCQGQFCLGHFCLGLISERAEWLKSKVRVVNCSVRSSIERSDTVIDKTHFLMQHYNQPEYDSVDDANQQKHEKFKAKDHPCNGV